MGGLNVNADEGIEIWRAYGGVRWRVYGILRRPLDRGTYILSPGHLATIAEGSALTYWGARRKARRALRWNR